MRNIITRTVGFLVKALNKAIAGMTDYAEEVSLPHTIQADLPARLANLTTTDTVHKEAVHQLKIKRQAYDAARLDVVVFVRLVRELLRDRLGPRFSQQWVTIGFTGSLAIPQAEGDLLRILHSIKAYITSHPIPNAGAAVTPARAQELYDAFTAASAAVAQHKEAADQALQSRLQKELAAEQGLRILLGELHRVLTPLDARWFAFGFKKPGAKQTPDVPENLTAVLIGETAISMKWSAASRAEYYRVWKKVLGVDTKPEPAGSPADLDYILEHLPRNSIVEVYVSAMNNGGESALSEGVLVETK